MDTNEGSGARASGIEGVAAVARALAGCAPGSASLYPSVADALCRGFGFARVAVFRDGTGRVETVPAAHRGFDDLEVLHGQLPPVDRWPLLHRAIERKTAVFATDAQLDGDVPLEVAGALALRSVVGVPFVAGDRCLGFAFCDRGGGAFQVGDDELSALGAAGAVVAAALVPAYALDRCRRANELKTQFVALASHELRAPVAAINGVTTTLRRRGDELQEAQRTLLERTLDEQAERMRRLVDQLLDLTKLESDAIEIERERFVVRTRIEGLVRQLAPDRLTDVLLDVAPDLETFADPAAFDRIVSNLVTNALRYGEPPVRITAEQLDTHFRLWVEDRGDGVPPEFAPRLFERFARGRPATADGGSGLGLAIAQSFAQAQGGRLLYEDAKPHGARFQLVLPVREEGARARS